MNASLIPNKNSKNNLSSQPLTMSSREIADLLNLRHDSVVRSIKRLIEKGIIVQPPMVDEQITDKLGRYRTEKTYRIGKRDSYVIVAQLSPEFTAKLVDRWQELEEKNAKTVDVNHILNDPDHLKALLLDNVNKVIELQEKVKEQEPKVRALEHLARSEGLLCITDVAKALEMKPKDLFKDLQQRGWIYRRAGGKNFVPYQQAIQAGLMDCTTTTIGNTSGSELVIVQARVTPKGMTTLSTALQNKTIN